MIRRLRN